MMLESIQVEVQWCLTPLKNTEIISPTIKETKLRREYSIW